MGIKPTFSQAEMRRMLDLKLERIDALTIQYMQRLGEMCLNECRTNKTYMDQTGNLTASMGYVIVSGGKIVNTTGFGGTQKGSGTGKALAYQLATGFNSGYALIVVAGMHYAYSVESKGYNVLSSAELLAEQKFPAMMQQMKKNINIMKV